MKPLAIAAIIGVSVLLLVWGLRDYLIFRFQKDRDWIAQTALRFSPQPVNATQYATMYYVGFCLLLLLLIFITPSPIFAVIVWLVMLATPRLVVEWLWQRRRARIDKQLPAAISTLSNSLRAGLTLVQAIERLAETAPDPIRTDFQIMASRYSLGAGLETTIVEARQRLASQNFNLFASAMLVNREMGGDVAETLSRISQSLDKLHHMRQTVEAHTSEGRTNIKVLLVAPVVLLMMISTVDGEGVMMLFTTTPGYAILLVAGFFIGLGVYFASKITRQDV